ncbi:MAG: hypothetical protein KKD44_04235 [Proteobacteria bacterium]|nr:hypothetical protein [Pseudomonadota bacterium]
MNGDVMKRWLVRVIFSLIFSCVWVAMAFSADFQIYTIDDLQDIRNHLSDRCILMNDIDASVTSTWADGQGFEPIGTMDSSQIGIFTGSFEGNNHRITGLYINRPELSSLGLFSIVSAVSSECAIKDLILENVTIIGQSDVGALVGMVDMNTTEAGASVLISNCTVVSGQVNGAGDKVGGLIGSIYGSPVMVSDCFSACSVSGISHVGGLAGYAAGFINAPEGVNLGTIASLIRNTISGTVTGSESYAGGLVGAGENVFVQYCANTGSVTGNHFVGGLAGEFSGDSQILVSSNSGPVSATGNIAGGLVAAVLGPTDLGPGAFLRNCYSIGPVTGGSYVGGLVAANAGTVEFCYSTGPMTGNANTLGGFVFENTGTLNLNVWDGDTSGISSGAVDGQMMVLSTTQMMQASSFPSWDFITVWAMETTAGHETYPFFRFKGGDGTVDDPYRIGNVHGLQGMGSRELLSSSFILVNDVDAGISSVWNQGAGFEPIGLAGFNGHLDGKRHVIRGLFMNRPLALDPVGLFGTLGPDGIVENLVIENASVIGGEYVGLLAGLSSGILLNCSVSGTVCGGGFTQDTETDLILSSPVANPLGYVGGLIGRQQGGHVSLLKSDVEVRGQSNVGGLIGQMSGSLIESSQSLGNVYGNTHVGGFLGMGSDGSVELCRSKGTVRGNAGVGGFTGFFQNGTVIQCVATGFVTGLSHVGGFIGMNNSKIKGCFSTGFCHGELDTGGFVGLLNGDVKNSMARGDVLGKTRTGGFAGSISTTEMIRNCYSSGAVSGTDETGGFGGLDNSGGLGIELSYWDITGSGQETSAGGEGLDSVDMISQASFEGWDFITVWNLVEGISRPYLIWDILAADLVVSKSSPTTSVIGQKTYSSDVTLTNLGPNPAYTVILSETTSPSLINTYYSLDEGVTWMVLDGPLGFDEIKTGESYHILFKGDVQVWDEVDAVSESHVDFEGNELDWSNNRAITAWETTAGRTGSGQANSYSGGDGSGCFISSLNDW